MTIDHNASAENAATDAVVDLLDVGSGANGTLDLIDEDGSTVLASFDLPNPAFGAASSGEATANSISDTTADASGTADSFEAKDADGNVEWTGKVAESSSITGVSTANNEFTVGKDLSWLVPGDKIRVSGSTGNDGDYTVVSVSGAGPTTVTVVENVSAGTADGEVHPGDMTLDNVSINSGQTVSISSWKHKATQ